MVDAVYGRIFIIRGLPSVASKVHRKRHVFDSFNHFSLKNEDAIEEKEGVNISLSVKLDLDALF